jgi:TusA-related sulfurtransferase
MVPIYRDEKLIQNNMINKIKSGIFNSELIILITINAIIFHNITIYSNNFNGYEVVTYSRINSQLV